MANDSHRLDPDYPVPADITESIRMIYTSHSIDNVFDYCERKFEFLNIYDKRPPRESGYAASVGTALHDGLQAWLIARAEKKNPDVAYAHGFMAMMQSFPWNDEAEQAQSTRTFEKTCALLNELIHNPIWDSWELMRIEGYGWAIEVPFLIKHTSVGTFRLKNTGELCMFATQGKIDFILRNIHTGKIRTWDLKTTVTPAHLIQSEYKFSGQQVGYGQVLQASLGISLYDLSCWYLVGRFSASDPPEVIPVEMKKDEDSIDDYWFAKIDRLNKMKFNAERGWFPRRNGGCNSYKNECSMFSICPSRDYELIELWFKAIEAVPQVGYDPWITLEV